MPKINVYLPDDLAEAVKAAGVPVSPVCQRALEQAVRRITAIREVVLSSGEDEDDLTSHLTRFTGRAATVVKLAGGQARERGASAVGTEHLLGGLLAEGGNLALRILRSMEIEPSEVMAELERQSPTLTSPKTTPTSEDADDPGRRFTGPAAGALQLAVMEASSLGHNYVGCEHLLLGLIGETEGTAGHVLRAVGAELRLSRRAVTSALAGYVHLKEQTKDDADTAALRHEMQHVTQRLGLLEERLATLTGEHPAPAPKPEHPGEA